MSQEEFVNALPKQLFNTDNMLDYVDTQSNTKEIIWEFKFLHESSKVCISRIYKNYRVKYVGMIDMLSCRDNCIIHISLYATKNVVKDLHRCYDILHWDNTHRWVLKQLIERETIKYDSLSFELNNLSADIESMKQALNSLD